MTNGAHIAAFVGGFIGEDAGWRWCFWVGAIVLAITWVVNIVGLPETLYHRDNTTGQTLEDSTNKTRMSLFNFTGVLAAGENRRRLNPWDFTHVFAMLYYPSVALPALYYSISFGISTVLVSVTAAGAFGGIYKFGAQDVGLAVGVSTTIGTLLGEALAGPVSDWVLFLHAKRHDGELEPEARLQAIWPGFILCPAGTIIEGVCFQYKTHWIGPCLGCAISVFGLQIISTNVYAYMTDVSNPSHSSLQPY